METRPPLHSWVAFQLVFAFPPTSLLFTQSQPPSSILFAHFCHLVFFNLHPLLRQLVDVSSTRLNPSIGHGPSEPGFNKGSPPLPSSRPPRLSLGWPPQPHHATLGHDRLATTMLCHATHTFSLSCFRLSHWSHATAAMVILQNNVIPYLDNMSCSYDFGWFK